MTSVVGVFVPAIIIGVVLMDAAVDELPIRSIQGRRIDDKREAKLLVRVTAKTAGLGTDIVEERWFKLDDPESVELGRYAPIDVDPAVPIELWGGWADFEGLRGPAIVPSQPSPAVADVHEDPERPESAQTTGS